MRRSGCSTNLHAPMARTAWHLPAKGMPAKPRLWARFANQVVLRQRQRLALQPRGATAAARSASTRSELQLRRARGAASRTSAASCWRPPTSRAASRTTSGAGARAFQRRGSRCIAHAARHARPRQDLVAAMTPRASTTRRMTLCRRRTSCARRSSRRRRSCQRCASRPHAAKLILTGDSRRLTARTSGWRSSTRFSTAGATRRPGFGANQRLRSHQRHLTGRHTCAVLLRLVPRDSLCLRPAHRRQWR